MASRPERMQEPRLKRHGARDVRDPKVRAGLRREAKLMARYPEDDAIDAWNEAAYEWNEWK